MTSPLWCWLFHSDVELVDVSTWWGTKTRYRCAKCHRLIRSHR